MTAGRSADRHCSLVMAALAALLVGNTGCGSQKKGAEGGTGGAGQKDGGDVPQGDKPDGAGGAGGGDAGDAGPADANSACGEDGPVPPSAYRWTRRIGGTPGGVNTAKGVAVDTAGNLYFTGFMWGTINFAEDWGSTDVKVSAGSWDGYVTKVNSDGSYGWTRRFGGGGLDYADDMVIDSAGNLYLAGYFAETANFAADWGGTDVKTTAGSWDAMLIKINADGTYAWTKRWGGAAGWDFAFGIALRPSGNVLVTGTFIGTVDFAADWGKTDVQTVENGAFLLEMTPGGGYVQTRHIASSPGGNVSLRNVQVSSSGTVYLAGNFSNTVDFGAAWGTTEVKTAAGGGGFVGGDAFVTAIHGDGSYGWTHRLGGSCDDYAAGLMNDSSGDVYVTGGFQCMAVFSEDWGGVFDKKTSAGHEDAFLTKIKSDGSYGWTRRWGGPCFDNGAAIAIADKSVKSPGTVYVAGNWFHQEHGGPACAGASGTVNFAEDWGGADSRAGHGDASLTKINADGSYGWTRSIGGKGDDISHKVVTSGCAAYYSGKFGDTVDFGAAWMTSDVKIAKGADIFVTKLVEP